MSLLEMILRHPTSIGINQRQTELIYFLGSVDFPTDYNYLQLQFQMF